MSFTVYWLILDLCVFMHACNSRHLGVFHKEPKIEIDVTSKKSEIMAGLEGRNLNENSMEKKEAKFEFHSDEQNIHISHDSMMFAGSDINLDEQNIHISHDSMMFAGSDINLQTSHEGTKIKEWENHVRSTIESKQKDAKEKINNLKDKSDTEDVGVMDYAQPHRKPPIHNLNP